MSKFVRAVLAGAALAAACTAAVGQTYPEAGKPIRFVIGFPAGSTIDNVSRILLDDIRTRTGALLVIENKPGALGTIGLDAVTKAPADGYTLMPSSSATHSSGPFLSKAAQKIDPLAGFSHVARVVRFDIVVVGSPGQGHTKASDLITAAKAKPNTMAYGYGSGTGQVAGASFSRAAGIDVLGVSYKGQPPALTDLIGGQVSYVAADLGAVLPLVRASKLSPLVLASSKRSTILPDVPTARELGLTGLDLTGWIGVAGPAQMPAPVVEWWMSQLTTSMSSTQVQDKLRTMGMEPDLLAGEKFQQFVRAQVDIWGKQIRAAGIQAE